MIRRTLFLLFCLALAGVAACTGGAPKDEGQPVNVGGGAATADGGIDYKAPAGWIEEAPSAMRKGQYRLPHAEGDEDDAELAVFYFGPGQGGTVQANIDRWIGQFAGPDGGSVKDSAKISTKSVNGRDITIVDVSGTFITSMGPMMASGPPKPNYRMLGAIVETPSGPWFFKLTGPQNTVAKWEESFNQFTDSIRVG